MWRQLMKTVPTMKDIGFTVLKTSKSKLKPDLLKYTLVVSHFGDQADCRLRKRKIRQNLGADGSTYVLSYAQVQ